MTNHEENLSKICNLLENVKARGEYSETKKKNLINILKVDRVDKEEKFTKLGECEARLGGWLDIVIVDRSEILDYVKGEAISFQDMEPMLDRLMIAMGYLFVYNSRVYMCDPRIDPKEPLEEILKASKISCLIDEKYLISTINYNLQNLLTS